MNRELLKKTKIIFETNMGHVYPTTILLNRGHLNAYDI